MLLQPHPRRLTLLYRQPARQGQICLRRAIQRDFHASIILSEQKRSRSRSPQVGTTTPVPDEDHKPISKSPFYFQTGYAGWAKRPSRPFPPPFFSPPSGSFSDPLSTHNRSRDRRPQVNGEMILGVTNGDDAMLVTENLLAANDGVGAWAQKEKGHAPLWSRLIIHFWASAAEKDGYGAASTGIAMDGSDVEGRGKPDPVRYLSEAYAATKEALSGPTEWLGTTTASSALLHWEGNEPVLYATQLGDCKVLVLRPDERAGAVKGDRQGSIDEQEEAGGKIVFASKEQWHYFDCPRQLGTNSPDTPEENAVLDVVALQEGDVVLAMSDGVTDNLWEHEISANVLHSLRKWMQDHAAGATTIQGVSDEATKYVAQELVLAARQIAEDPFAESPFMEKAVDEGLAIEGGKLDDISVVVGFVSKRDMT